MNQNPATKKAPPQAKIAKAFMAFRGMNQKQLGEAIGWKDGKVSDLMTGRKEWSLNEAVAIAEALDISPATFFEDPEDVLARFGGSVGYTENSDHEAILAGV
jgi:antitoxin component HigA of HigAB toxin-antitoxin module